jgi:hypothetical protein
MSAPERPRRRSPEQIAASECQEEDRADDERAACLVEKPLTAEAGTEQGPLGDRLTAAARVDRTCWTDHRDSSLAA